MSLGPKSICLKELKAMRVDATPALPYSSLVVKELFWNQSALMILGQCIDYFFWKEDLGHHSGDIKVTNAFSD